jgi:sec-independent protein translocase protein TatA
MGGRIGITEILLILLIVLLLFGGRKIPELMKGLGRGIKEFKDASKGDEKQPSSTEKTVTDKETAKK